MIAARFLLASTCVVALAACSDSGPGSDAGGDSPATTVALTGLCRLVTADHVTALFGPGYVLGDAEDSDASCNYGVDTTEGGSRGRIYLGGSGISYDKTVEDSTALGQPMTDVAGLGSRAHFTAYDSKQQYWIVIEDGTGSLSVLVQFKNGAVPPAEADLIAALTTLAEEYLAAV